MRALQFAFPVVLVLSLAGPASAQTALQLRWELKADVFRGPTDEGAARQAFTLTNRDTKPLPARGWAIYFNELLEPLPHPLEQLLDDRIGACRSGPDGRDSEQRDGHLRSGDFFDTETYPTISFHSTAIRPGQGNRFELDGELTIKGETNPVYATLRRDMDRSQRTAE